MKRKSWTDITARVTPEAPAIGDPITIELRVRAPVGADVRFPVLPDTGTRIEPLDPRAQFPRARRQGLGQLCRVNVAVIRVIKRARQIGNELHAPEADALRSRQAAWPRR